MDKKLRKLNYRVLLQWRDNAGLSERDAAELVGCSREAWRGWESGERKTPRYIGLALAALAAGLDVLELEPKKKS